MDEEDNLQRYRSATADLAVSVAAGLATLRAGVALVIVVKVRAIANCLCVWIWFETTALKLASRFSITIRYTSAARY